MKIDTSNIDKKQAVSDYEKRYGGRDTMPFTMTFEIMKWTIIGFFLFLILGFIGLGVLSERGQNLAFFSGIFKDCISVLASMVMAFFGYFMGKGKRTRNGGR